MEHTSHRELHHIQTTHFLINLLRNVILSERPSGFPAPGFGAVGRESKDLAFCRMPKDHHYYVYLLTNSTRRSLYTGVTSKLEQRVFEHKQGLIDGFTRQYRVTRLVYFERFQTIQNAISREKQIKGWRREKKIWLIQQKNPSWRDLSNGWYDRHRYAPDGNARSFDSASPRSSARCRSG